MELHGFRRFRRFLTAPHERKAVDAVIHRVIRGSGRPENGEKWSINGEKTAFAAFYDDGHTLRSRAAAHTVAGGGQYAYC